MKLVSWISILALSVLTLQGCKNSIPALNSAFADSLASYYTLDSLLASNQRNMDFWRHRFQPHNPGNINELQYASTLVIRFKLKGDIRDLDSAIDLMKNVNTTFAQTLPGPMLNLVSASIMHHRFGIAT